MNHRSQFAQADSRCHRHTDFTDHLAGMARYDGCSEEFHKTIFLTVQNGAVHVLDLAQVSVQFYAALAGVAFIETDVSDFRIGVSAPGHGESACLLAAKEEGILNDEPGGKIGGMGE